jgi:biotin transporter BioY
VAIVAIVTGHMARQQIRQTGEQGMWMATLGMVIGIVHVALIGILVLAVLFVIYVLGIALFGFGRH